MQTLLDRIPTRTPLEMRDRAMLELAYSCGLRAEEVVNLGTDSPDFDGERLRVEGKGGKTRLVPIGEPAQVALTRYLERGRPALAGAGRRHALLVSKSGRRLHPSDVRRRLQRWVREAAIAGAFSRTRCDTRSRPICWREGRTCGASRSPSGTPASRRRRFTPKWSHRGRKASTLAVIPGLRKAPECR